MRLREGFMDSEPRKLPGYSVQINNTNWYCYHCVQYRKDAPSIQTHLLATHDRPNPVRGEDYQDGCGVQMAILQRQLWEREQPALFGRRLASLRGADDFAFEVGPGAPVEKIPPRA